MKQVKHEVSVETIEGSTLTDLKIFKSEFPVLMDADRLLQLRLVAGILTAQEIDQDALFDTVDPPVIGAPLLITGQGVAPGDSPTFASLTLNGDLTVNGTTTTVNSTVVTIDDPVFTLGGDTAPAADDNKDRGIEFRYHTGAAARVGFFGFDDSTGNFTFIPDATNTSEVFSGALGVMEIGGLIIDGTPITTGQAIDIPDLDGLTSGNALNIISNSADVSARNLVQITNFNAAATGAVPLFVRQQANAPAVTIDQNATGGVALRIDSEATTAPVIDIEAPATTDGDVIRINDANFLTSGSIANFKSNSTDVTARDLVAISNSNALAVGAIPLRIVQNSTGAGLLVDKNESGTAIDIDGDVSSASDLIGLKVNVANPGAGNAYSAIFELGNVGIGTTAPTSPLHINQSSASGAVPVLTLEQTDVSEEMVEFITTIGVGNAIEAIGAKTLTTTHFIKVTIPGGLTRYFPVGTIA